ncbi:Hypothetical_protein [Hexamita inflata]|uniref:Hypothetical_protein n=1 Tax=Hexamita inflata TaxID=28002 RepID=A0AA86NZR4_9EUKA|nr:Hypothetical protein HINF_LOCUS15444 [Hexamita inflata]
MQLNSYAYEIVLELLNLVKKATRIRRLKVERTVSAVNPSIVSKMVTSKFKSTLTSLCNQIVSMAYQNRTIRLFYADTIIGEEYPGVVTFNYHIVFYIYIYNYHLTCIQPYGWPSSCFVIHAESFARRNTVEMRYLCRELPPLKKIILVRQILRQYQSYFSSSVTF